MIVGIDLGTTNSLLTIWRDGAAHLVANSLESHLTPSVVGLDDNKEILVGQAARDRLVTHPHLTTSEFKRYMGTEKEIKLGALKFRPEELSSFVIRSLLDDAERETGVRPSEAIITVPAYFNDPQRKATIRAGELAGLKVRRLLNEPTAAALSYGIHEKEQDSKLVVVDLGGGTFDVSVLDKFEGIIEILGSGGDNFLGGADFTQTLADEIAHQMGGKGVPAWQVDLAKPVILKRAEEIKHALNSNRQAEATIPVENESVSVAVSRDDFKEKTKQLLRRISAPVVRTLRDTKLDVNEIDDVVLIGGASRMQLFRDEITRLFGRFPANTVQPDEIVALGAGTLVGMELNEESLQEVVLTDVMPYTLGVEVSREDNQLGIVSGYYMPVIERNRHIPTSCVETVYTLYDNQKVIKVNVYQGESPVVKDNVYIGSVSTELPQSPAGEEAVDIRFTYDVNGALQVEVTVQSTGEMVSHIFTFSANEESEAALAARFEELNALKIHPREQMVNTALMNRAHRMYAEYIGDARQKISDFIFHFETELASQDEARIAAARTLIETFLDSLEQDG